ncbi:MAG: spore coat associated protein CotJA [Lachnospiraceae bacterium]|nr:spore coat associated protein CotJA [Lachnospiraceae bacterium]MDD5853270.1 spore coat associated protein CotJA [Lachnospiraceae bacterium]
MKDSDFLQNKTDFPVGMAYVPWQKMEHIYENLDEAFSIGTIFPELNKPFEGRRQK